MAAQKEIELTTIGSINEIEATDWDALANPDGQRPLDPFTTHRFLKALEDSKSVGPRTGWQVQHMLARLDGKLIAAMPLYVKGHSQGEYIFDHSWAHAFERAGGRYYPKLLSAVPFTPVTGRRFLTHPDYRVEGVSALVQGAVTIASNNNLSSFHVNFCDDSEARAGQEMGLLHRTGQQFHWYNDDYPDFPAFLARLSSRKRKAIRRERDKAQAFGGTIQHFSGDEIRPEHWEAFWAFYQDTGARKWGRPYLTRAFFDQAQAHLRDDMALVLASRDGQPIAGALNFIGRDTLFGRYWGATEHVSYLHFECCYYRAMDFAIANGLSRIEAGAQGEHKLARGYLPVQTHSLHAIADPGFAEAVQHFLQAEAEAVEDDIDILTSYGPFKRDTREEAQ